MRPAFVRITSDVLRRSECSVLFSITRICLKCVGREELERVEFGHSYLQFGSGERDLLRRFHVIGWVLGWTNPRSTVLPCMQLPRVLPVFRSATVRTAW